MEDVEKEEKKLKTDPKVNGIPSLEEMIDSEMNEMFRYAQDSDVIINL